MRSIKIPLLVWVLLSLVACGGGSSSSEQSEETSTESVANQNVEDDTTTTETSDNTDEETTSTDTSSETEEETTSTEVTSDAEEETTSTETEEESDTRIPSSVSSALRLPEEIDNYSAPDLPDHFTTNLVQGFDNTPLNNVITDSIATLGRVLFYEKQLSANGTVSCGSCHFQANGFSDPNQLSTGFQGGVTERNSMSLANSQFYEPGHFFWDERADTLEDQVLVPIQNDVEMGITLEQAESNIIAQDYYSFLFQEAFGDTTVSSDRIALALSQFIRSMVSYQSKYDTGVASNFNNFTASENRGRQLFFSGQTQCANCHVNSENDGNEAIFQPNRTFNNGLDADLVNDDNGAGDVLNNQNQNGRFKVGSLRNIELSAPYMHDGRFATLEEVVEHYNSGVQDHPNLDNRLQQNGNPRRLNLSDQEKQDLVAFMLTLTDDNFIADDKFSDPFITP